MIRVLIVEDSPVEQALLAHILSSDPHIDVVGVADDGEQALADVARLQPDLVTMDIHMPRLNGFETTRRMMETTPLPIVIISGSFSRSDTDKVFLALEAGALAVVRKPRGVGHPDHQGDARELVRTVKTMSEVRVVRRWPRVRVEPLCPEPLLVTAPKEIRLVAIGASTGGPSVLQTILAGLPRSFSVPVLVVQHMATGFMDNCVSWIAATTGFPATIATHGEPLLPGRAYFAPDGVHLEVSREMRAVLSRAEPERGLRPSIARLFRSVAENHGPHAAGVLLTGMGRDGADDLKLLREKGGVTIVQDEESSIVFGMPGEAVKLQAADYIFPPEKITGILLQLAGDGRGPIPSEPPCGKGC